MQNRIKQYVCDLCSNSYFFKAGLARHKRQHSDITKHKCGRKFNRSDLLKCHMKSHNGAKLHTCTHCQKSFKLFQTLKTHLLIHGGVKPHKCNLCDATFFQAVNLKSHEKKHKDRQGEKAPYICQLCNRSFKLKSNLETHLKNHPKCDQCEKTFKREKILRNIELSFTKERVAFA